jgi:CubicO group peptidase (beta-lactamase class C family)
VFAPLQMTASGFHGVRTDLASRMMPINPQQLVNECVAGKTYFCGSAGLWIPIEDYARFATMLLRGGVAPNGTRLLKAESVKLMATNHAGTLFSGTGGLDGKGVDMGLSVLVVRDNAAAGTAVPNGSFGWDGVGSRRFWVIPAENTVIVMYVPGGMAAPAHRDIEAAVMKALGR